MILKVLLMKIMRFIVKKKVEKRIVFLFWVFILLSKMKYLKQRNIVNDYKDL